MLRTSCGLAVALVSLLPNAARAEIQRCAAVDVDVAWQGALFQGLDGDTGWFPASSPAQLRLTGRVAGETNVSMGLRPTACWDGGMKLAVPGRPGDGWMDYAYGAEMHVYAGIHTSILGYTLDWEGEIPLPQFVPTDLLLSNGRTFDGGANARASVSDATSPVVVFSTDVLRDYVGIAGISGGLRITATGSMTTSYRTTEMRANGKPVTGDDAPVGVGSSTNTYGDALDVPLTAAGRLTYQPTITITASFSARFLGYTIIDKTIAAYPIGLPTLSRDIELSSTNIHIPLPNARKLGGSRIDFASGPTQRLPIHNSGEAPLRIEVKDLPAGVAAKAITVAPGADAMLEVTATDDALASGSGTMQLVTNDPDNPLVDVALGRDIGGTDQGEDTETTNESSAGCNAGGGGGLGIALFALLALGRARRRSN